MAIQLAENGVQSKLQTLVDTFAPQVDNSAQFNLIADVLGVALGMFSAPFFNKSTFCKNSLVEYPSVADFSQCYETEHPLLRMT